MCAGRYDRYRALRGDDSRAGGATGRQSRAVAVVCRGDRLAWPIREGVPIMLVSEAREISQQELLAMEQQH